MSALLGDEKRYGVKGMSSVTELAQSRSHGARAPTFPCPSIKPQGSEARTEGGRKGESEDALSLKTPRSYSKFSSTPLSNLFCSLGSYPPPLFLKIFLIHLTPECKHLFEAIQEEADRGRPAVLCRNR